MMMRTALLSLGLLALGACEAAAPEATSPPATPNLDQIEISQRNDAGQGEAHFPDLSAHFPGLHAYLNDHETRAVGQFLAEAEQAQTSLAENDPDYPFMTWEYGATYEVSWMDRDFISLNVHHYTFTGGAHPNPALSGRLWSKAAGAFIGLDALFTDLSEQSPARLTLAKAVYEAIIAARLERNGDEAIARDPFWTRDLNSEHLTDWSFVLTPARDDPQKIGAITFVFGPYVVGSYAEGMYQAQIPQSVFHDFLTPAWQARFGGEPASEPRNTAP
ncbi:DUF3298 and DUF4163 domain-containing protein [Woodsholea maritima]|uniref:DUF3298 and DUF4163 domain-containing protein n=1 Tax=Woodsholea maritima TaxID=240237 RepID=UPI0003798D26|nr:DUF3298 and DUF4163 domain-containing protein [Woodsholea maritima]